MCKKESVLLTLFSDLTEKIRQFDPLILMRVEPVCFAITLVKLRQTIIEAVHKQDALLGKNKIFLKINRTGRNFNGTLFVLQITDWDTLGAAEYGARLIG